MFNHRLALGSRVTDYLAAGTLGLMHRALGGTVQYKGGLPILPGALPKLGHFPWLLSHSAELLKAARERLGSLYYIHMGPTLGQVLMCAGPEAFEILRLRSSYIATGAKASSENFLGRHGLLVLRGDAHHRMRATMNPPFVPRGLALSGLGQVMAECIEARLTRWSAGGPLRILAETQTLALELIFRLINVAPGELDDWQRHYRDFMQMLIPIPWDLPGLPRRRALAAKRWLVERMEAIIRKERQSPPTSSLVSVLAHARDESGAPLSLDELADNLRLLILAGHETTASVLAWMVVELARDPVLWRDLCAEAERVGSIPLTPQAAKDCPLAESLFRETLRLYPPLYITARTLGEEHSPYGVRLPAGQRLLLALGDLARDERVFPDPERFNPRRWFTPRADSPAAPAGSRAARTMAPPTPLETAQFGGGPHFCLGYHLAVFEATQFAIGLARHFGRRGKRPQLRGPAPRCVYYPLNHPSSNTQIEFV